MSPGTTDKEGATDKDMAGATVWAAEHGASNRDIGRGEDAANVGHRWRIHGRLEDRREEEDGPAAIGAGVAPAAVASSGPLDVEKLRSVITQETEIDLRDVSIQVSRGEVTLRGSVAHQGEIRALTEILQRQPGVVAVHERLLTQVA
jgi:hypothetical protein